jgi:hypothetical protein
VSPELVKVTQPDGSIEFRPASSFRKPKTQKGRCTRCGVRVRWRRDRAGRWQLLDRGGLPGELHVCSTTPEGVTASR